MGQKHSSAKGIGTQVSNKRDAQEERTRATYAGMMLHQDGSLHQWIAGKYWI